MVEAVSLPIPETILIPTVVVVVVLPALIPQVVVLGIMHILTGVHVLVKLILLVAVVLLLGVVEVAPGTRRHVVVNILPEVLQAAAQHTALRQVAVAVITVGTITARAAAARLLTHHQDQDHVHLHLVVADQTVGMTMEPVVAVQVHPLIHLHQAQVLVATPQQDVALAGLIGVRAVASRAHQLLRLVVPAHRARAVHVHLDTIGCQIAAAGVWQMEVHLDHQVALLLHLQLQPAQIHLHQLQLLNRLNLQRQLRPLLNLQLPNQHHLLKLKKS